MSAGNAAHYVAHLEDDPGTAHQWNLLSLGFATLCDPGDVEDFRPSLFVNLGRTYELTGNRVESARFFEKARRLGLEHAGSLPAPHASIRERSRSARSDM